MIITLIGVRCSRRPATASLGRSAEGNPELHRRPVTRRAFDAAPSASDLGAFPHEGQAKVTRAVFDFRGVIADAVVHDPDQAAAVDVSELHPHGCRARMLADVCQRLLDDSVYQHGGRTGS